MEYIDFLARWGHILFGIAWIGLLYYFNFVQGGYMNAASDEAKVDAFTKLVPSALWWFRWAAALTFLTGIILLYYIMTALSTGIVLGVVMGTIMAANVWFVIWPNQKVVIASNESIQGGGEADPNAAGAAAKALLASRTNTFFSAPMLYFMVAHMHGEGLQGTPLSTTGMIVGLVIIAAIEANALWGKTMVLTTVRGVIVSSLVLTVIMAVVAAAL
ncbi:MAG: urate hydroxylase PuuD [Gammaproteobacteria bacterium]|nr:urate hydroxylase PuuD [Gammaproteobacteria bacterium]